MQNPDYKKLERILKTSKGDFSAIIDAIEELEAKVDGFSEKYPDMKSVLEQIRGTDGYTPQLGVDYFTESQIEAIKEQLKPIAGVDYPLPQDGKDGESPEITDEIINEVAKRASSLIDVPKDGTTPVKGVDYFTESDIEEIIGDVATVIEIPTAEETARAFESLPDDKKLDAKAIKGLISWEEIDNRALSILDQRTQFLINKVANLAASGTGGGTTYTFNNGLTETAGVVQLGGNNPLIQDTTIDADGNAFKITGAGVLNLESTYQVGSSIMGFGLDGSAQEMYICPPAYVAATAAQYAPITLTNPTTGSVDLTTRLDIGTIYANTSGGMSLYAANRTTQIGLLGAGNTANVTWYGNNNFDTVTASRVAQFGASKTLESSSVTNTELGYLSGVTSAIQTQIDSKLAKSAAAYTMPVNNTNATADMGTVTFKTPTSIQSFTPANVTWTGTTVPSGTQTGAYKWIQIDGMVWMTFASHWATDGVALTAVEFDLPSDMPAPNQWAGLTAANQNLNTAGVGASSSALTTLGNQARIAINNNAANNGFRITMNFASSATQMISGQVVYAV